jgi:hypothetical protein
MSEDAASASIESERRSIDEADGLRARSIALHLPQFHPIPENDEWWGPGFTEWTNVARAKSLFRGHHRPALPGELGFYDLRLAETRNAQAELARHAGVESFCFWHYWFAGHRLLEGPVNAMITSGEPDIGFCLGWANQTWSGVWHGNPNRILIEQTYPGLDDYRRHFDAVLPALRDQRYTTVDRRSVFVVFRPTDLPDAREFADTFRTLADDAGLPGLHLVGFDHHEDWRGPEHGFDASIAVRMNRVFSQPTARPIERLRRRASRTTVGRALETALLHSRMRPVHTYDYATVSEVLIPVEHIRGSPNVYPCVIPNWDNTPRSGRRGSVLLNSTPDLFEAQMRTAVDAVQQRPPENRLVFIKSWNEWAEGNYIEPDEQWGRGWLDAHRRALGASP